ncbi:LysM peptidoglycan-binding domain-containing protein [Atopococcus tabaci]|uniref:LysM peptidoglycan-binding domain-containing protein n=1 Tax=Atopococcus tabaci TaxID=269774 RepID=UPI002409BCB4|nr:LysM peptidoglycan-binding domain-containing protein [Atopococcus tabaci]
MTKHLIIVGHGWQRDGSFDPGATGYITKGEHRYFRDDFVPAMKKYLPKNADFIFYDKKKVSNHGNLAQLVKDTGADEVTELHFDAHLTGSSASGGHVIIHADYTPDDTDLRLRDAIEKNVGVRYSHKGHKGISGRVNLYNVNVARNNGITYRLIETGFGTNRKDADTMMNDVDTFAKDIVEALVNAKVEKQTKPAKKVPKAIGACYTVKPGDTLSKIAKQFGTTVEKLASLNELKDPNLIQAGEDIEIPAVVSRPSAKTKIAEDGYVGPELVSALQEYYGLIVDGEMWGQVRNQATLAFNQKAVRYGSGGSPVVRALQKQIGAKVDGYWGVETTRALQRYLGTPVDGEIWRPSTAIKEMQRRLNNGTF